MQTFIVFLLLVLVVHSIRVFLLHFRWPQKSSEPFHGELFECEHHVICLPDRSHLPDDLVSKTTIICFPGFLEDMRYFLDVHKDTPAKLIIINNANYHCPFELTPGPRPNWFDNNSYRLGTIAHDAHCLNQILRHMTTDERVVLHGHSRGGAVVLEAGRQDPELTKTAEAILEAAVVPQGRLAGGLEKKLQPVGYYLFPFFMALMRLIPEKKRLKSPILKVRSEEKEKVVAHIPFAPKQYRTALANMMDIVDWQFANEHYIYSNFRRVSLFVGEKDRVLWRQAMVDSATKNSIVDIVATQDTDHFISVEQPETIRAYFREELVSNI